MSERKNETPDPTPQEEAMMEDRKEKRNDYREWAGMEWTGGAWQ